MRPTIVQPVPVPSGSLAAAAFPREDYADAYRVVIPATCAVDTFARAFLTATPGWAQALMRVRERAVRLIGLKRIAVDRQRGPARMSFEPDTKAGIFRVFACSADEILMGEDDRHLDFRVSLLIAKTQENHHGVVTTVMHYHGWLGRAYFLPVRPFHGLIVRAMLRETAQKLRAQCT